MNGYNPQDWAGYGPAHGVQARYSRPPIFGGYRDVTGMEAALPSPPPPYFAALARPAINATSNPSSFSMSPSGNHFVPPPDHSPTLLHPNYSPTGAYPTQPNHTNRASIVNSTNHTPTVSQQTSPTLFPPPPINIRDRSSSRARGVLNNFSAWANRHKGPENSTSSFDHPNSFEQQTPDDGTYNHVSRIPSCTYLPIEAMAAPPAARRAISVGYAPPSTTQSRKTSCTRFGSSDPSAWAPGMPLPPPPPGLPPASRSQSMGPRFTHGPMPVPIEPFTTPPRQSHRSTVLGSVPPTPAGWVDEDLQVQHASEESPEEHMMAPAGLLRLDKRREGSMRGIRERRSESRARSRDARGECDIVTDISLVGEPAKPADLVLPSSSNILGRRRHAIRPSLSNIASSINERGSPSFPGNTSGENIPPSDFAAKRSQDNFSIQGVQAMPTPPWSPEGLQNGVEYSDNIEPLPRFLRKSLDRYRALVERERQAATDAERLRLFADFVVAESRLRRQRFVDAFDESAAALILSTSEMWLTPDPPSSSPAPDTISLVNSPDHIECKELGTPSPRNTSTPVSFKRGTILSPMLAKLPDHVIEDLDIRGRPSSRWWDTSTWSGNVGGRGARLKFDQPARDSKHVAVLLAEQKLFADSGPHTVRDNSKASYHNNADPGNASKHEDECIYDEPRTTTLRIATFTQPVMKNPELRKLDLSCLNKYTDLGTPYRLNLSNLVAERACLMRMSDPKLKKWGNGHDTFKHPASFPSKSLQRGRLDVDSLLAEGTNSLIVVQYHSEQLLAPNAGFMGEPTDYGSELLEHLQLMKHIFDARENLLLEQFHLAQGQSMGRTSDAGLLHSINTVESPLAPIIMYAETSLDQRAAFSDTFLDLVNRGLLSLKTAFNAAASPLASASRNILALTHNGDAAEAARTLTAAFAASQEHAQNRGYATQRLRHLHNVLAQAQQVARRPIDAQLGLLHLQHEVSLEEVKAGGRVHNLKMRGFLVVKNGREGERTGGGEVDDTRLDEELRLRVAELEALWAGALGDVLSQCMSRIGWLLEDSGNGGGGGGGDGANWSAEETY